MTAEASLARYYETKLAQHGDTAAGAGWPNDADRELRFDVMLDVARFVAGTDSFSLCDFGCGTGEMLRRIRTRELLGITYSGVDRSEAALAYAREKFPEVNFSTEASQSDVVVVDGVFNVKVDSSDAEMWSFMTETISNLWCTANRGIAFNVMSPIVDWEREDLFHVSYDRLAGFLHELAGRRIGFRADYGLYEYVAYAMKTL